MSVKQHEPICLDSAQDRFWWNDHFLGDQLQDEWRTAGSPGCSAVVVDQQTGGIVRIATGGVNNDAWRIEWADIRSLLVSKRVTMEVRLKLTQTTNVEVWVAIAGAINDWILFEYDTTVGANWQITTDDTTGPTSADSGIAADTSYHIFRIECFPTGEVHFYIDGVETANSPLTADIPTAYLQPYLRVRAREALVKSVDVDYVAARQDR